MYCRRCYIPNADVAVYVTDAAMNIGRIQQYQIAFPVTPFSECDALEKRLVVPSLNTIR